jgi:hypothetical protein
MLFLSFRNPVPDVYRRSDQGPAETFFAVVVWRGPPSSGASGIRRGRHGDHFAGAQVLSEEGVLPAFRVRTRGQQVLLPDSL